MYWLQNKANYKKAKQFGLGKKPDKCKEIGHVWIPQFDTETYIIEYICYNCETKDKSKRKFIPKSLPNSIPVDKYNAYSGAKI